jgi:hypothetical protein
MMVFLCRRITSDVKLSEEHADFDWVQLARATEKLDKNFQEEIRLAASISRTLRNDLLISNYLSPSSKVDFRKRDQREG